MARPQKTGLDYFPFDVGLLKDKKLRRPKMKYGYLASAVYLALLSLLYSDKGYYIPYGTPNEKDDCIWYVFDCLQGKYIPKVNTIADVIDELVASGLFSLAHYPKYITSKRAQTEYYSATATRKTVVIDDAIWLLSLDEMQILSEKHVYYLSKVAQSKNGVYRSINSVNRTDNTQSRVENRKDDSSVCIEKVRAFCEKWNVKQDTTDTRGIDFELLDVAYSESGKFLQSKPIARCLSWIVKNYVLITAGKYKDFGDNTADNRLPKSDNTADEINRIFGNISEKDL